MYSLIRYYFRTILAGFNDIGNGRKILHIRGCYMQTIDHGETNANGTTLAKVATVLVLFGWRWSFQVTLLLYAPKVSVNIVTIQLEIVMDSQEKKTKGSCKWLSKARWTHRETYKQCVIHWSCCQSRISCLFYFTQCLLLGCLCHLARRVQMARFTDRFYLTESFVIYYNYL